MRSRSEKKEDTRRALTRAALDLVQKVGWKAATVDKIAEAAGVAKGTFFVHFASKEALVETVVALQIAGAKKARDGLLAASPIERLRGTVLALGRHAGARLELTRAVLIATMQSEDVAEAVDDLFAQALADLKADARAALAQGLVAGIGADELATLLMAAYLGAALHVATSRRAKPIDTVLRSLVDAQLAAFTVSKPRKKRSA